MDEIYFKTNKEEAMRGLAGWAGVHLKEGARVAIVVDRPNERRTFTFTFHEEGDTPELEQKDKIDILMNGLDAIISTRDGATHTKMRIE